MKARTQLVILVFAAAIIIVSGCSDKKIVQDVDADISSDDPDKGSVTIQRENGEQTLSTEGELPKGFPKDIPLPEGAVILATSKSTDSGNITVAFEAEQPFDEVKKLYEDYIASAGLTQSLEMMEDGYFMYSGTRGVNEIINITFSKDLENEQMVSGALVFDKKPQNE